MSRKPKLPPVPEKATLAYRKMPDRVDVTDAQIADAILHARGNLALAARRLGVGRQFVDRRVRGNSYLTEYLEDVRESRIDHVEDSLYNQSLSGNTQATIFFLRTQGKGRGYDINNGTTINLTRIDYANMTTEQLKRLASGESPEAVLNRESEIIDVEYSDPG